MLLRQGFNAAPQPVDEGIDLLASKQSEYVPDFDIYLLQVKTTAKSVATIRIPQSKFKSYLENRVNLIVVHWPNEYSPRCLVLPPTLLHMATSGGHKMAEALIRVSDDFINLQVEFHTDDQIYLQNRHNPFTAMKNRLDLIESTNKADISQLPLYARWSDLDKRLIEFDDAY